jgi:hypothetical protein
MAAPKVAKPPQQRQDLVKDVLLKCGKDPVHFIKTYIKIQHATKGTLSFDTYPFQDDCVRSFVKHRYNIVVKSRQLGLSTITAAYALWLALFRKDKNILIIATKLPTAVNFIRKVKFMLQSLPPWLLLCQYHDTQQSITFSNGSMIKAIPTSEDAGRSEALSLLIVDEAAIIKNFDDIWVGLSPTLATGGSAILISTPKGVGGTYHKIYMDAVAGVNNFNPIKLPWHVHPEHDEAWYKEESKQFAGDTKKLGQEFDCDFVSSGDTFLQLEQMAWLKSLIKEPILRTGDGRRVWVWAHPQHGRKYIISADVSRGDAGDHSTFHVIDTVATEVVAEYKGKITPDRLGEVLVEFGKQYNTALICPENNTFGYMTCSKIRELKYPNLYYKNARYTERYTPRDGDKPGFDTQSASKQQALSKLEELIRNKLLKVYSQRLVDELSTFVWNGSKAGALKGYNDDLVMSAAIGTWILDALFGSSHRSDDFIDLSSRSITVARHSVADLSGYANLPIIGTGNPTSRRQQAVYGTHGVDFSWVLK